jgi:hypothetical protein
MDQMAQHGRYGDSMLVHMHPAEVAGIASLVPGGLTTNPVTGQPEAFAFLAPMLLGAAGISMTPLASAALVGGITAVVEKDLGKGLLAGVTGLAGGALGKGLGDMLGTATDTATQTVVDAGSETASQAATEIGAQTAQELASQIPQIPNAGDIIEGTVLPELPAGTITNINSSAIPGGTGIDLDLSNLKLRPENISAQGVEFGNQGTDITKMMPSQFTERVSDNMNTGTIRDILQKPPEPNLSLTQRINEGVQNIGTMGQLGILGASQGALGDMEMREANRAQGEALRAKREEKLNQARSDLAGGMSLARQRSEMGQTVRMNEGGSTGGATVVQTLPDQEASFAPEAGELLAAARFFGVGDRGYGGLLPSQAQANLRGMDVIAPPKDYLPGLEPEFNYFQTLERDEAGNIIGTPQVPDRSYRPTRTPLVSQGPYFDPILQSPQSNAQLQEYRRTLAALDPGPTDVGSVLGIASKGERLTPQQQAVFEGYYSQPAPSTPTTEAAEARAAQIELLMGRGLTYEKAIKNQNYAIAQGFDLNNDGTVTDKEYAEATSSSGNQGGGAGGGTTPPSQLTADQLSSAYPNLTPEQAQAIIDLGIGNLYSGMGGGLSFNFKAGGSTSGAPPEVALRSSLGETRIPGGGIAQVPTEFNRGEMGGIPPEAEIQALQSAVLGEVEEGLANQIIEMFVQKYGPEIFQFAREAILRSVVPNAQTEGMISGPGGGMDDMVQGMIGSEQPVAVSPGEFIVPADVVSGIGDGSSDAGAKKLDTMMERVRVERNGTTKQAPQIDERKVMPA